MRVYLWNEVREQSRVALPGLVLVLLVKVAQVILLHFRMEFGAVYITSIMGGFLFLFAAMMGITASAGRGPAGSGTDDRQEGAATVFADRFLTGLLLLLLLNAIYMCLIYRTPARFHELYGFSPEIEPLAAGCLVLVYIGAMMSSLFTNKAAVAIILMPVGHLLSLLLILPSFPVILLLPYSPAVMAGIFASIWIFVLIGLSFRVWRSGAYGIAGRLRSLGKPILSIIVLWAVVFTALNIYADMRLNAVKERARQAGLKVSVAELIPPPLPDDINGAIVYEKAFKRYDAVCEKYDNNIPWDNENYGDKSDAQSVRMILGDPEFQAVYGLLQQAINYPAYRFNLDYDNFGGMMLPHYSKMRSMARFLSARSQAQTAAGLHDEAWESAIAALRLSSALQSEFLIDRSALQTTLDRIALSALQRLPRNRLNAHRVIGLTESTLNQRQHEAEMLYHQRMVFVWEGLEKNPDVFVGMVSNQHSFTGLWLSRPGMLLLRFVYSPVIKVAYSDVINNDILLVRSCHTPNWLTKDDMSKKVIVFRVVESIFGASSGTEMSFRIQALSDAVLQLIRLAMTVQIYYIDHNRYPEKLSDIAPSLIDEIPLDPFTGKPFIYRKTANGFILYSAGRNQKDDGGKRSSPSQFVDDIVWQTGEGFH